MNEIWHAGHARPFIKQGSVAISYAISRCDTNYSYAGLTGQTPEANAAFIDLGSAKGGDNADGWWFSAYLYRYGTAITNGATLLSIKDGNGYAVFRLIQDTTQLNLKARLYGVAGLAYYESAFSVEWPTGVPIRLDIHNYTNAENQSTLDLWWNGVNLLTMTSSDTTNNPVKTIHLGDVYTYNNIYWSELLVGNYDIRPLRVKTLTPSAAGTYPADAGLYTAIDEWGPAGDVVRLANSGSRASYKTGGLASPTHVVQTLLLGLWVANDGFASVRPMIRSNDANADGDVMTLSPTFSGKVIRYDLDPVTNLPWEGDLSTIEFGLKVD